MTNDLAALFRAAGWGVDPKFEKKAKEEAKTKQREKKRIMCCVCKGRLPARKKGCKAARLGGWVCPGCIEKAKSLGMLYRLEPKQQAPKPDPEKDRRAQEAKRLVIEASRRMKAPVMVTEWQPKDDKLVEIGRRLHALRMIRSLHRTMSGVWTCELMDFDGKWIGTARGDHLGLSDIMWRAFANKEHWLAFCNGRNKDHVFMDILYGWQLVDRCRMVPR